jgi:hypothetical protein
MAAAAIDLQPHASLHDEDCEKRIIRANQVRIALQRMLDI